MRVPERYIPVYLTPRDRIKQARSLAQSRRNYKKAKYTLRAKVSSFKSRPSKHVVRAKRMYNVDSVEPSKELARATGCSMDSLRAIVAKGQGAFYSSGSRPNQTPESWGLARLASALTGGKAAAVDYDLLERGCGGSNSLALEKANEARVVYGHGRGATRKIKVVI